MLIKGVVVPCAILILITIICAMSIGWLLAHPVQTRIGNPPADLNAELITFASDSDATVHGWYREKDQDWPTKHAKRHENFRSKIDRMPFHHFLCRLPFVYFVCFVG